MANWLLVYTLLLIRLPLGCTYILFFISSFDCTYILCFLYACHWLLVFLLDGTLCDRCCLHLIANIYSAVYQFSLKLLVYMYQPTV